MCRTRRAMGATTENPVTVHAAHLLATHTMHPELLSEELVLESPVFEQLGVFPDDRRAMLAKRDIVRSLAGVYLVRPQTDFDLICLGSGPAGLKAAIQAAKAGFRAAIIEREPQIGGYCLLSDRNRSEE